MATQKVPLTRIDETGASDGKVLKYSSGAITWGDDASGGSGGGTGTAFKNTILGTESVSANSLEQYQVHSGLEILSGGTFTINASGDLVLDAPDDPNKAAGWTDAGNVIHTTDSLNKIVIGQTTALSADDMLSVANGNVTVAGSVSAQGDVYGKDVYGNARTMTNPGVILQVKEVTYNLGEAYITSTNSTFTHIFSGAITPSSSSNKVLVQAYLQVYGADTASNWDAPQCHMTVRRLNTDGTTAFSFISNGSNEDGFWIYQRENHQTPSYVGGPIMCMRLDSPNTTDEVVYDVVAKIAGNYTHMYVYGGIMHMQEIAG